MPLSVVVARDGLTLFSDDWQVKAIRRERDDVTDTPLDFSSDIDNLQIQLTNRVTTVSGSVSVR